MTTEKGKEEQYHQLDRLIRLIKLIPTSQDHHQVYQQSIQSHQSIQSKLLSTISLDSLSDQQIADRLEDHLQIFQEEFDTIDQKLSKSTETVKKLSQKTHDEAQELKPMSEQLHEEFIEFEDEFIDYNASLKPIPDHQTLAIRPKPILIDTISGHINWLKELKRLKLWLSILLDFKNRVLQLASQSGQQEPQKDSSNQFESFANELFEIIKSYQHLKKIAQSSNRSRLHLFEYIDQILRQSLISLIETVCGHVAQTLESELEWPQPSRAPLDFKSPSTARILGCFKSTVVFQNKLNRRADLISLSERKPDVTDHGQVIWVPLYEGSILLKAVLRPIILRFRFHFEGQRATNRLDKPEWYFNHILDRLVEHEKFLKTDLQKLFELCDQGSINVFHEFTVQLVRHVERKLKRSVPEILEMKPILAHTIEKAIEFDREIKKRNYFSTESQKNRDQFTRWLGTADVILSNPDWFNTWFQAEKRFVDDMYLEIISHQDTWEFNEEDQRLIDASMPATNSALKIQDLVEQIKTKYEELPRLSYQTDFLIKIQIVVLEAYLQRLSGILDGFERNRLIQVVGSDSSRSKMNMGLKGLERLIKVYISCNWILYASRSWTDDLFYAELFEKLKQDKTVPKAGVDELIRSIESIGGLDLTLFSPMVMRFEELSSRAESAIVKQVVQEISMELKPYLSKRWDFEADNTEGAETKPEQMELSTELIQPISTWKSRVNYLIQTVRSPVKLNRLLKRITKEIESQLVSKIIFEPFTIRAITLQGALQLQFDLLFGWLNVSSSIQSNSQTNQNQGLKLEKYFSRVLDCCKLLSFPSSGDAIQPGQITFEELMRICFETESSQTSAEKHAKILKDQLGITSLSRSECQLILKRRPECWKAG